MRLPDGALLNRYWDDRDTPREESYREDVATARALLPRRPREVYRNLRAAAESGWDFSSRWLPTAETLATIRTVELIPVDLNSLLYAARAHARRACAGQCRAAAVTRFTERARDSGGARSRARLWNAAVGPLRGLRTGGACRMGVTSPRRRCIRSSSASATRAPGQRVATVVERRPSGSRRARDHDDAPGQQWDAPNGWAPLQWIAVEGLNRYGHAAAGAARSRTAGSARTLRYYAATGKLIEKYDVSGDAAAGGGEYPLQDGFGWTNGVLRKLMALYPEAAVRDAAPAEREAVQ